MRSQRRAEVAVVPLHQVPKALALGVNDAPLGRTPLLRGHYGFVLSTTSMLLTQYQTKVRVRTPTKKVGRV